MKARIVIPARWGSTRLPGKPLVRIAGVPLLERVVAIARGAADGTDVDIVVATDDRRIADHAAAIGCPAVMTDSGITTGSGRALAAVRAAGPRPDIVCCLQGDAPFVPADAVRAVLERIAQGDCDATTPATALDWPQLDALRRHKERSPSSGTTCLVAADGRALWFSKAILPQLRDEAALRATCPLSPVLRHLGLYCYTLTALERYEAAPPSANERYEGLEQLRFLELGLRLQTVAVAAPAIVMGGIDTPDDVALAERLIGARGDPFRR